MTDVNQLITDHLDIWTSATEKKSGAGRGKGGTIGLYGLDKLRELILELAVHGKLVPQHADEIDATELIARFDKSRSLGLKEKRFKKQKLGEELSENEEPFSVPPTWEWVRLGEIGFVCNGNSVSSRDKREKYSSPDGLPFVATKNVGYGFEPIDYDVDAWIPVGEAKFKIATAGTPLICSEGGSAGKKCGITDRDVCFGNKLFACDFYDQYHPKFLLAYYQTPSFFSQFSNKMTGIIGGISLAKFLRLPVPVPPFEEQKRIVSKLDELMAICDRLDLQTRTQMDRHQSLVQTCLAALTNSRTSNELDENWSRLEEKFANIFSNEASVEALQECFLDLVINGEIIREISPELGYTQHPNKRSTARVDWKEAKLGDLLEFGPKNGLSPRAADRETDVKVLTLAATTSGEFDGSYFKFVDIDRPKDDSELWLKDGDILVQRANALEYVGISAIYRGRNNEYIYPDLMIKMRASEDVLAEYLLLSLQSQKVREYFRANASGTSGSMPKINHTVLKNAPIFVPPIDQQELIVDLARRVKKTALLLRSAMSSASQVSSRLADTLTSSFQ